MNFSRNLPKLASLVAAFLGTVANAQTMAPVALTPTPLQRFVDNNGNACSGCKVFTYAAGTTTKQATYNDSTGASPNTNPVVLNTRGEAAIWILGGQYKFVLSPSTDSDPPTNAIWTVDNLTAGVAFGLAVFSATPIYAGSTANTQILSVLGSLSNPDATMNSNLIVEKITTGASTGTSQNSPAYFAAVKTGSVVGNRASGVISEAYDRAGGNGTFVEGGRFHATVAGVSGQADGVVCLAQSTAGTAWDYLIGCESDIENNTTDAPSTVNLNHYAVGFLATNGQPANGNAHIADAAFATNNFSAQNWRVGFDVLGGVSDASFRSIGTTLYGLDLSSSTNSFAAIEISNNSVIRSKGVGGADLNLLYVPSGSNSLIIGTDTQGITLPSVSTPSTPGAGFFDIYMSSADNKLHAKGPNGTDTVLANP